jgi:diguanylate cyclase (GGDEF)-like protein
VEQSPAGLLIVAALLGSSVGLLLWGRALRARLRQLGASHAALAKKVSSAQEVSERLERQLSSLEKDQRLLVRFVREFPHLTRQLHSRNKARDIPRALLEMLLRTFEPKQAVVLLRARESSSGSSEARFVVAAVAPQDSPIQTGMQIVSGRGELGYVAESQRVVSRSDLDQETPVTRARFADESLPGFKLQIASPMVFDQQTVGILALTDVGEQLAEAKSVLRMISQMGAFALFNATAFSQMKRTADVDGLTGAFNKRFMTHTLGEAIFQAEQNLSTLSVFLFDIDHFKSYNDQNGHVEGDHLLRELVKVVRENLREEDLVGRFGGEEFLLLLPDTSADQAFVVAEKVRAAVASYPFRFAGSQPLERVSISGGVAAYPAHALDSRALLHAADEALYEAKRQGRDRVLLADPKYLGQEPEIATGGFRDPFDVE